VRKERRPESDQARSERASRDAQTRVEDAAAEAKALDVAVKRSIKLHGP
jgi:hypothetical protein